LTSAIGRSRTNDAAVVSTIVCVARFGPPDEFHNQPTRRADFSQGEPQAAQSPEPPEPFEPEPEPTPWYRKPKALLAWTLCVAILIALIIYGILQLTKGGPSRPTPTTTTTPATTTTTPPSTTTTPSTTTGAPAPPPPPATGPAVQPPAPPPEQTRRHLPGEIPRLPPLPSTITIPQVPTVITLPPHL
jgi:hypothetical protein